MPTQFADDVDGVFAVQHLRVTGDQHPHIVQMGHRPWQCSRDVAQATGFHQVGNFRSDEQHFFLVGILAGHGGERLGAGNADRLGSGSTYGAGFADMLMSTFSLNI
ncbi:hypothetical protein D3C85_1101060 [compost metagenome]